MLDSDGQHPPSEIHKFINQWQKGSQVVVGVRKKESNESLVKKIGSATFYSVFNRLSGSKLVPRSTDFRLIDREVIECFKSLNEKNRITRGLIDWLGYSQSQISFKPMDRLAGNASYTTKQLIKLAANSFVSLSLRPLFMFGWLGVAISVLSFVTLVALLTENFLMGDPLNLNITGSGYIAVFIALMVGVVLMSQGVLVLYVSHIYTQAQDRPLFIVNSQGSVRVDD